MNCFICQLGEPLSLGKMAEVVGDISKEDWTVLCAVETGLIVALPSLA